MDPDGGSSKRTSFAWKYFTKKNNFIASCNVCKKDYSYKATVSNLAKHWRKIHAKDFDDDATDASDGEESNHSTDYTKHSNKETLKKTPKSTWQYFEVLDNDKFAAKCKVCEKEVAYDSISDLREHAREHDAVISDDEDWGEDTSLAKKNKKASNASKVWQYMQVTDKIGRNAECLLCRKSLSYLSSMTNLRKHLRRAHPLVNIDDDRPDVDTKMIISQDGQIYEVATSDGESDPIQTNEIYLDDSTDGDIVTNFPNAVTSTHIKKERKTSRRKSIAKDIISNTHKKMDPDAITDKNTRLNTINVPTNTSECNMSSIDYFGQYIVSLLKEMPKHVAGQLQSDIIKQIFTAKIALETPYSVTLGEKPVTVTINNGAGPIPEITVHNTSDVVMNGIEETEETQKLNDIWNYFEQEGSKARCVVCRENAGGTTYEVLKAHLFEHHPKLLLHLVQEEEQDDKSNPATDDEDNDNTYTEVVYLEQDSCPEDNVKPTEKPKINLTAKRSQKRKRNNSSSDSPIITLKKKEKEEKDDDSELEAFIKYIKCLLKKLPTHVFSKVQVDILKTIMDAQYSSKLSDTHTTDIGSTPSILTDIANGSVTHVLGETLDSSTLLGNYTVTLASKSNDK